MIPERNLMIEKVKKSDRLPLLCTLSDLLKSGLAILTSCETLNKYIHFNLEELSMLLHKLEVSELRNLYIVLRQHYLKVQGKDPINHTLSRALTYYLYDILGSDCPTEIQHKLNVCVDTHQVLNLHQTHDVLFK